jgi:hypothetical protein
MRRWASVILLICLLLATAVSNVVNIGISLTGQFVAPIIDRTIVGDGKTVGYSSHHEHDSNFLIPLMLTASAQTVNELPVADAGSDQIVGEGDTVSLSAADSFDPDSTESLIFSWQQTTGTPAISLAGTDTATPSFIAPNVDSSSDTLEFQVTVTDSEGATSMDEVQIVVNNIAGYHSPNYSPSFPATGSSYYDIPDSSSLQIDSTFAAATWFKTSSFYSGNVMIVNKGGLGSDSAGENMNYGIWMNSAEKIIAGFETSAGVDKYVRSSIEYNNGKWHYAVVTFNDSIIRLYIDGAEVDSLNTSTSPDSGSTDPLRIGANSRGTNNYFKGEIDEVRVWDRAVTASEVSDQYSLGKFDTQRQLVYMNGASHTGTPIANAGADQTVDKRTTVILDGTGSSDPDGDSLSYSWKLTGGPTIVELSRANTANPTFIAPEVNDINATFSFELTVDDSYGGISTDTVNVIVQNTGFPDFNFAAVGDFGCTENTEAVVAAIARANPELVMGLGDYSSEKLPDCWYGSIGPVEDRMHYPTTVAIGNHETASSDAPTLLSKAGRADFLNHFELTEDTTFYSYDYQNVHFLVLNPEKPYSVGTAQYKFVKNDLHQARLNHDTDWIVAYFHRNIYGHSQTHPPYMHFRNTYQPLFDAYNVDLVLQGHVHNYQRTKPLEYNHTSTSNMLTSYVDPHGQIYVIAGMGGKSLAGSTSRASYILAKDTNNYGFMDIAVINNGSMMVVRFYNTTDHVLDEFTIMKDITNTPPIANAGTNKVVNERSTVTLDGSASFDPDSSDSLTHEWKQTDNTGYTVTLSPDSTSQVVTFRAPDMPYGASVKLLFKLIVFDGDNARSSHTVRITVNNIDPLGYAYDPYFVATGTDSYSIPDTLSLRPSIFTVTAWFKTDSSFSGNAVIVNKGGFGTDSIGQNLNYGVWMDKNERVVGGFELADGTDKFIVSPNAYNDNQWHYVSLTYDGGTIRLYIDNIEVANMASTKDPDTASSSSLKIGANARMDNLYFIGDIDEMRLWNRALSAGELAAQYDNGLFDTSGQLVYFDGISHITS